MAKDNMISYKNVLEVPINYDLDFLKCKKQDASKLFSAIKKFYKGNETMD